jgi:LPXTG-site transpeptidase (sortase) family protein
VDAVEPSSRAPEGDAEPSDRARRDRRAFLGVMAGAAVGLGALTWELRHGTAPPPAAARTAAPPTTARPTLRVTADPQPQLPIPQALPDPDAPEPDLVLGMIAIPRLDLEANLQEGIALASIDRGPGHWPGTAMPGQLGNLVVAGHRVTYTHPFRHLELLRAGDPVVFVTGHDVWTYETRGVVVVPANAVDIAAQSYAHTATLFACHPPGEATERIVAKLRLLDKAGRGVDADGVLPPLTAGSQQGGHVLTVQAADPFGR